MAAETQTLIAEAETLGLFQPHGAFEVHCAHCHARLDGRGDCATCGLIGRPAAEIAKRASNDEEGVAKLLRGAVAKRKAYKPAGAKGEKSLDR